MNFILFNPDELRAQSVHGYGCESAVTPHMDRLAAEGTRFDQCHVQHTVCTPSRCSFMTGWYPHVAGHRSLWHLLRPHEPNLLKYLKQAGYTVFWRGKNDLLAEASFADSVDDAKSEPGRLFAESAFTPDDPRYWTFLTTAVPGTIDDTSDGRNVEAALNFLRSKPKEPFCVYLPLIYPHCPYGAPQPYHDMIDPDDLPPLLPADLPRKPPHMRLIREYRRLNEVDASTLRKVQAVYLGMTAMIDTLLGRVIDTLEQTGLAEDTAIVFFSDHGDYAGDYGLVEKWTTGLEDVLTRVPLIIRMPGGKRGHVVSDPVELFDIFATVMQLANIEPTHTHFARSLVPQLHGAQGDADRAVFAEGGYSLREPHCFEGKPDGFQDVGNDPTQIYYPKGKQQQDHPLSNCQTTMIRTRDWKLIRRPQGINELYQLTNDPAELNNLYEDSRHHATRQQLEQRLLDWAIQTADVTPHDPDSRWMS